MNKQPADIYRKIKFWSLKVVLVLLVLTLPATVFAWPTDSQWIPLVKGGSPIQDNESDATGGVNVVPNDGSNPAAYIYNDGAYLYYRLRLDANPSGGGQGLFSQFGWGFEIDTDQNAADMQQLLDDSAKRGRPHVGRHRRETHHVRSRTSYARPARQPQRTRAAPARA